MQWCASPPSSTKKFSPRNPSGPRARSRSPACGRSRACPRYYRAIVATIGEDVQVRVLEPQAAYQRPGALVVVNVRGRDQAAEDQALRVHDQVALAPIDALAPVGRSCPIMAMRPPLPAHLTLWLSKMAAGGIGPSSGVGRRPNVRERLDRGRHAASARSGYRPAICRPAIRAVSQSVLRSWVRSRQAQPSRVIYEIAFTISRYVWRASHPPLLTAGRGGPRCCLLSL